MRRVSVLGLVFVLCAATISAHQVTTNVSVLPLADPDVGEAHLLGDGYLQRQVEPTIGVSTRNPDHLIAFFNDYRAVDVPDDEGLGTILNAALKSLGWSPLRVLVTAVFGIELPAALAGTPAPMAAAEAWVGMSRSYDGGLTWVGGMLPGAPFDGSPASLGSPVHGMEAATDPYFAAAPCGYGYTVFVAFTRGGESRLAVARYQDLNDRDGGDSWSYQGTSVVEIGNNATHGYFLDKPFLVVDVNREPSADRCAHRVYLSYTTFNGLDKEGKFQSKLTFASSEDYGVSWDKTKFNVPYNQNQGTAIAVDPRPGTPTATGGGTVYLVWRHFFDPDAVVFTRSLDYGVKFDKPVELTAGEPMAPFDQPTVGTYMSADPVRDVSFRSNGFPTVAATADGTVFVGWQERVDIDRESPGFARPLAAGSPRIVAVRSSDGGETWSGFNPATGAAAPRQAVDLGDRDQPGDPALPQAGFGALPQWRPSGPQLMPRLVSAPGRLLLAYTESRGLLVNDVVEPADLTPQTGFASGYHRLFDVRAALLDPDTGQLLSTTQVSRYPIRSDASLADGEDVADVAPLIRPCSPLDGSGFSACVRQLPRNNVPQSDAGRSPFMGDYSDAVASVQLVPEAGGSGWRWATAADDVPWLGFHVVFADNRHLLPPTIPAELEEIDRYTSYGPPGIGGACVNPGSRNTDVFVARVDAGLAVHAPSTFKLLGAARGYPLTVANRTGAPRSYRLSLSEGALYATFSSVGADVDSGDVTVLPYSSVCKVVYLDAAAPTVVRVEIREIDATGQPLPGGQYGSVTIGGDISNIVSDGADETQNPFVENPFVENPFVENPFVENPFVENPFVENPFVENPFVENATIYDAVDTVWDLSAAPGSPATSYLAVLNIDNAAAFLDRYAFQLMIYRSSSFGLAEACAEARSEKEVQLISSMLHNPFVENPFVENPFVENPFVENPFVENPFVENPFVENATFTMAPADGYSSAKLLEDDGTLKAPRPPDRVRIRLRALRMVPYEALPENDLIFDPSSDSGDAPSLVVMADDCDTRDPDADCYVANAPDLVPSGVSPTPLSVRAGESFVVPTWSVLNRGTRTARAENRALRYGYYLSGDEVLSDDDELLAWVPSATDSIDAGVFESVAATTVGVGDDVPSGDYWLLVVVDDLREVSEFNEMNNVAPVALRVTPSNTPPVAVDDVASVAQNGGPIVIEVLANDFDPDGDPLSLLAVGDEAIGTVVLDGSCLVYTPALNFTGLDSFTYLVGDGRGAEVWANVSVTVTDAIPDYGFLGLLDPWSEVPRYVGNIGSSIPLKWHYTDPAAGTILATPEALPEVRVKGPFGCEAGENGQELEVVHDPGSSGYQYDLKRDLHQFNWETTGLAAGCYNVRVFSHQTSQLDGPFLIELR